MTKDDDTKPKLPKQQLTILGTFTLYPVQDLKISLVPFTKRGS